MKFNIITYINDFVYQGAVRYKAIIRWFLVVLISVLVLVLYRFEIFERLELLTLDSRFMVRHVSHKPSGIVFIDMSEDSIAAIGRWPWPRKWHAALIKALSDYDAKLIAFDVIFSEPQDGIDDETLKESIMDSGRVYLPLSYDIDTKSAKYLYKGEGIASVVEPMPLFRTWLKGIGHINALPDVDGILRRIPPVISYNGNTIHQFGVKIGCDLLGLKDEEIVFRPDLHAILLQKTGAKTVKVPLDENNQLIINWLGKWGKEFDHYSYIDVIKSYAAIKESRTPLIDLNVFRDKICIVGLTALGLTDIKPIPIENAYPAVGINAMIIYSFLQNDFIYDVPAAIDIIMILLFSILSTLYLSKFRVIGGMLLTVLTIFLYIVFSIILFCTFNIAVLTFYPVLAIFLSYSITSLYAQILQSIERTHLFRQATRDGLTGLYNIRHFNLLFEAEFKNASMYKFRHLSVIMADIDNFKHTNDTYGHQAGDEILREVAKAIQSKCRQMDVSARYGGEEFIIMLTGANEKEAFDVAEKIRQAVEAKKYKFRNEVYRPSISIGVAQFSDERNKDELVEKADKALYKAKREGKNRVVLGSSVN